MTRITPGGTLPQQCFDAYELFVLVFRVFFFFLYSEGEVGNKSYLFTVLLFYLFIMEILKNTQK